MGLGGGGGGGDVNYNTDPWSGQQGYLKNLWERAENLPRQEPYPFPTYTPWSPYSVEAMGRTVDRARMGSPVLQSGQAENLRTTSGGYMDVYNTPGFRGAFQSAARDIIPGVQGRAMASGRYGGGLSRGAEIEALGDQFAKQWAPLYSAERDRMQKSSMMAPSMAEADYADIARVGAVGSMQEAKAGEALQDAINRWNFQQNAPYQQLAAQAPVIGGTSFGSTGTQSGPGAQGMNPLMSMMGGGLTGAGIGSMMAAGGAMSPWFPIAGAGLGLLASMF